VVFQHRNNDEGLLAMVFQQREENERLLITVFQQREKLLIMVFQQRKGKSETSAGRSCFGNENDGEMADWNVLGMGRNEKVFQNKREKVSGTECFSIVKNGTGVFWKWLLTMVFQQTEKGETIAGRNCFVNDEG
jgi:hypothetical protein